MSHTSYASPRCRRVDQSPSAAVSLHSALRVEMEAGTSRCDAMRCAVPASLDRRDDPHESDHDRCDASIGYRHRAVAQPRRMPLDPRAPRCFKCSTHHLLRPPVTTKSSASHRWLKLDVAPFSDDDDADACRAKGAAPGIRNTTRRCEYERGEGEEKGSNDAGVASCRTRRYPHPFDPDRRFTSHATESTTSTIRPIPY